MRTLSIDHSYNTATGESPHCLILDGKQTGVRWNGNTKKELYGDNPVDECTEDLAFIFVSELDYDLKLMKAGLSLDEKVSFFGQIISYLNDYPD